MKKLGILLMVLCIIGVMSFLGVSCKAEAGAEETTAAEAGGEAEETTAAEETAAVEESAVVAGGELKIVHIPKVVHPWFDIVQIGAEAMAKTLSESTDTKVTVEYIAPAAADVTEQNSIILQSVARGATGVFVDPLDETGNMQAFEELRAEGVLVTLYDCSPFGDYTAVGMDAAESARYAFERLATLLPDGGKVAVIQGFPTAAGHKQRYDWYVENFPKYPQFTFVDGGIDNDDMETARQQAAATIAANPDLVGYLGCNAAYPVGVSQAVKEAGKVGQIKIVGIGEMTSILDYIKEGVLESTVYVAPDLQGSYSVLLHFMAAKGFYTMGDQIPKFIDVGCKYIDSSNVDDYINAFNVPIEGIVE